MQMDHGLSGVSSSPETKSFTAALRKAQATYKAIAKSGENKEEGFRYATLKDICDALLPSLLANGFTMPTFLTGFQAVHGWVMVGRLNHESGEWVSCVCPLMLGFTPEDRPGIQTFEIQCTYAQKILFRCLAGGWLAGDEQPVAAAPAEEAAAPVEAPVEETKSDLIKRAEAKLEKEKDNVEQVTLILHHLDILVEQGAVTAADCKRLRKKYGKAIKQEVANAV